jgi:selenophosphate synthase
MPGGSWRNLQWVLPQTDAGTVGEDDLLLLADAQTSGGLLVAGELPGATVIGELVRRRDSVLIIRSPGNRAPAHPCAPPLREVDEILAGLCTG